MKFCWCHRSREESSSRILLVRIRTQAGLRKEEHLSETPHCYPFLFLLVSLLRSSPRHYKIYKTSLHTRAHRRFSDVCSV